MRKKIVLDTNVLVGYVDNAFPGFETVLRIIEKCNELEIISCKEMAIELFTTLHMRKGFSPKTADMTVRTFFKTLEGINKLILDEHVPMNLQFKMNEKDCYFCEFAAKYKAEYLISNDKHHFFPVKEQMKELYNVNVLSSVEFFDNEGRVKDWEKMKSLELPNLWKTD